MPLSRREIVTYALAVVAAPTGPTRAQEPTLVPQLDTGESLGLALGLSAATNFRDLGGYRTASGSVVARGLVYRSDMFNPLTADDIAKLGRVGLRQVYDLRTAPEIKVQPDQVPADANIVFLNVLADAQSAAPAQLEALLHDPKKATAVLGGGKVEAHFADGYREFVSLPSAKRAYRALYLALADRSNLPAVFHCTTGKDRTGWGVAALLTLLGVPKVTVMADYLRSNDYLLPYYKSTIDRFAAAGGDRAIPIAILGVKREYLEASFDEMQKHYSTIEGYFSNALGIDAAGQAVLRALLLEKRG
jgi:protein-tyrosine phosphatase